MDGVGTVPDPVWDTNSEAVSDPVSGSVSGGGRCESVTGSIRGFDDEPDVEGVEGWRIPWPVADMAPGLELGLVLGRIDRGGLNGHDVVTLIEARARQVAHLQAELLADMAELAHCPPGTASSGPDRQQLPDEGAADELRLALRLTRRAADDQMSLALSLTERLPRLWEALWEGSIDLRRARVISEGTDHLDEATARTVASEVLAEASQLSTGQIRARVAKLALGADPQAAKQRLEERQEDRRLVRRLNPDGTANLSGHDLPPERAASIWNRVQHIAAGLHRRGDPRPMDQLRADVFMDLLQGHHPQSQNGDRRRPLIDIRVGWTP